jgi:speckle-type POZ protein
MVHSGALEFKLDYARKRDLAVGDLFESEDISVGGHRWRIQCYPRGDREEEQGQYVSMFLELTSDASKDVKVIFHVFLLGRDGEPCFSHKRGDPCTATRRATPRPGVGTSS